MKITTREDAQPKPSTFANLAINEEFTTSTSTQVFVKIHWRIDEADFALDKSTGTFTAMDGNTPVFPVGAKGEKGLEAEDLANGELFVFVDDVLNTVHINRYDGIPTLDPNARCYVAGPGQSHEVRRFYGTIEVSK